MFKTVALGKSGLYTRLFQNYTEKETSSVVPDKISEKNLHVYKRAVVLAFEDSCSSTGLS
jgi:hypothetical protein